MSFEIEAPIDVQKTTILGNDIEKRLIATNRFEKHEKPFPYFTMISDKNKCFGIDISTIANPPRKGSHYYSIMFILPEAFKKKYEEYLGDENRNQHYLLQNAISSTMSKYAVMKGAHVKTRAPASVAQSKKITMDIRMAAMTFKTNYPKMIAEVEKQVENYKKTMG